MSKKGPGQNVQEKKGRGMRVEKREPALCGRSGKYYTKGMLSCEIDELYLCAKPVIS